MTSDKGQVTNDKQRPYPIIPNSLIAALQECNSCVTAVFRQTHFGLERATFSLFHSHWFPTIEFADQNNGLHSIGFKFECEPRDIPLRSSQE
jgi:hypothetical protein